MPRKPPVTPRPVSADDVDPRHRWDRPLQAPGHTQVDFEERVDFKRLHAYRLGRARQALAKSDLGAVLVEPPFMFALQELGVEVRDGQQVMLEARMLKSQDELTLLNMAAAMVDGVYQDIFEALKPGARENEIVALANKRLYEMGSDNVEAINAISGERCSPHPHNFTDRIIRPGDQAFFDIIMSFIGYRTCYYRTFSVGKATKPQLVAYKKAREWMDEAIALIKPGVTTDKIARAFPKAQEIGFESEMAAFGLNFCHGIGLGLHERPIISRLNSFDDPMELQAGMMFAVETYCPATDGTSAALIGRHDASVLEIALDHGFASAATFARAFRTHFGMSATRWRAGGAARWRARLRRKPSKQLRNDGKARARSRAHRGRKEAVMSIRVQQQPPYHVAYMRYVGPFGPRGIPELWDRLMRWAEAHGVLENDKLGIAYDDPAITPPDKLRYDACVVVPPGFAADRLVALMDVPGSTYAVASFVGTAHQIVDAWQTVFASLLPGSGYQPDDRPCYELYRGDPDVDATTRTFRCDLCLPVRPL